MKNLFVTLFISLAILLGCGDDRLTEPMNLKILSTDDSTSVSLKYGESFLLNDDISIQFAGVPTDSRCPIDAVCVWAGDGEVKLNIKSGGSTSSISLHTTLTPRITSIGNYEIQLLTLSPTRKAAEQLTQNQYSIELKIKKVNQSNPKPVYFIDSSNEVLIRHNPLIITDISIENNLLIVSASYSGGCADHFINLYAYSGISKSNPPQLSLVISHENSGDLCQAQIANKIKFDLKNLKNYINGMGISGKIILNIFGPDGNTIKQSPLVYSL